MTAKRYKDKRSSTLHETEEELLYQQKLLFLRWPITPKYIYKGKKSG
jgi:hypothetical protein